MKKNLLALLFALIPFLAVSAKDRPGAFAPDTTLKYSTFSKVNLIDLTGGQANYVLTSPDSMISKFGAALLRGVQVKGNHTLTIALKGLIMEERTNGEITIGNIYVDADFYLEENNNYTRVFRIDSLFEFNAAESYDYQIRRDYLTRVLSRIFTGTLCTIAVMPPPEGAPSFSLQEVRDMDNTIRSRCPVYTQDPHRGIYYTFEQFISNTPGDTAFIYRRNIGGDMVSEDFYLKKANGKKGRNLTDTMCYAIYNGNKWFKPYGKSRVFKEMTFKDGDFFYKDRSKGLVQSAMPAYGYYYGTDIASALTYAVVYLVAKAVTKEMNDKKPGRQGNAVFRYKLDPETGRGVKVERLE